MVYQYTFACMQCRARLASVCRHWRKVSTATHAVIVWQNVWINESDVGVEMTEDYASMVRWCGARGCHIRDLHLRVGHIDLEVRRRTDWPESLSFTHALQ
jgi:hypothetical protein